LLLGGESISSVEKRLELPKELTAPVEKDQVIGHLSYYQQGKKLGEVAIVAKNSVNAAKYRDYVKRVWLAWMM
jgi:D-alanyl-D-alanine carboxypeptidase